MGSQPRQLCQPVQPSADHLQRVEGCEEEEREEEGAEQDGGLQVPREEEGRAEHRGGGARTSRYQEQGTQGQADRDGDRGEIAEEVDDGGGLGQDCQHHEDVNTINCIFEEDEDRKLTSYQFFSSESMLTSIKVVFG